MLYVCYNKYIELNKQTKGRTMNKYKIRSAVYNNYEAYDIIEHEEQVFEASNETHAHALMNELMLEQHGHEAYDIDTTITRVGA